VIDLLDHQDEFLYSKAVHTGLVTGFGGGKTFVGILKTIAKKIRYPKVDVAYYLPTYPLIKDIAFPRFKEFLDLQQMPYELNKTDKDFITPYGRIILRSMDNPDLIVGYEVGYSLIDEADILATNKMQEVFIKVLARNRIKLWDGVPNSLDFVSTPEGFKFLHKFFVKDAKPSRVLIKAKTSDNFHLSESYIESMLDSYTTEQVQAYLDGEFVNLTTGIVYRHFSRIESDSNRRIESGEVLHIGMDFNITNMNAVVHVIDNHPIAVAELTGVYDTADMIELIRERYRGHSIVIYPDASGKNRSTSGKSDIRLLREARFTIKSPSKNPFVRDRVNAMNNAFMNNKGERRYLVNTNNCPVYSEALEQQTYKNGVPDKTTGFDHICEAGGYFIHQQTRPRFIRAVAH